MFFAILDVVKQIKHQQLTLTVMDHSNEEDLKLLNETHALHPLVTSELAHPTFHPKIEHYSDHTLFVFRFPQFNNSIHEIKPSEIDLILLNQELILVRYNSFEALDLLLRDLEEDILIRSEFFETDSKFLMYKILDRLFSSLFREMEHIGQAVDELEDKLFIRDNADQLVSEISVLRREAIDFKRIASPNLKILEELNEKPGEIFEKKFHPYLHKLYVVNNRLVNFIESQIATLAVIHETNESLLSHRLSSIMKVLTMFSVIVFPLTLFASIWGMNVQNMPLVGHPFDFWLLLIMMGLGTLSMLIVFKFKRWI